MNMSEVRKLGLFGSLKIFLKDTTPYVYQNFCNLIFSLVYLTISISSRENIPDLQRHSFLYLLHIMIPYPSLLNPFSPLTPVLKFPVRFLFKIVDITSANASLDRTSSDYSSNISTALSDHEPEQLAPVELQLGRILFLHHQHSILNSLVRPKWVQNRKRSIETGTIIRNCNNAAHLYFNWTGSQSH